MPLEGKRFFITGGSGFIGTALCERLVEKNTIRVYDTGKRNAMRYTKLENHPNLELVQGDILDAERLKEAMAGCDHVVHLAAIAGIDTVALKPTVTMKVNMLGTYNVLEAAVAAGGIKRFVDFSTSEVYGPYIYRADEKDMTTQGEVGVFRWTYAVSKLAAEHLTHSYHQDYDLPIVTLRPFNIYGPRQVGEGAIHKFIVNAIKGDPLVVHGDGNQIRAWCYIDDMVNGILLALEKDSAVGNAFNIGNPKGTVTILGLAEAVKRLAKSRSPIEFHDRDYVDVAVRVPSIKKAKDLLGYQPSVEMEEGILRTLEWYGQNPEAK